MVFEGILVDLLNRFLGPYVKNLDRSQLNIGIWGGDVLLEKLQLKENALEDLDLPIRVFGGYLERLQLKIPWTAIYSEPIVAVLDGVYVLAGPASAAKYDAKKAAKEEKERKEKQLKHIEEAKKKAREEQVKKEEKEKAPGFTEKLLTQIVRNMQITVKNIHILYEDAVTNPSHPFSFGVTLDSLFVQSTDGSYEIGSTVSDDPTFPLIYKVIEMNCLAAYLNSQHKLFSSEPPEGWTETLKENITRPVGPTPKLEYVVHPISARAQVQMTASPERAGGVPQALVQVVMKELAVSLGKQQFRDIVGLVESIDRMTINQKFLKYKPVKPVLQDLKGWWLYAITAVLEEDVKRRTQMWSWKHIRQHRKRCREYTEAYTKKLLSKSIPTGKLEELEEKLDVFNITICRQLAENEADKERERQASAKSTESWWSWATDWTRGTSETQGKGTTTALSEEELLLERKKLYEAIGYSEDAKISSHLKEYVAQELEVRLDQVSARLYDGKYDGNTTVALVVTKEVHATVKHRPTYKNIGVTASVGTLTVTGKGEDTPPEIVSTQHQEGPEKGSLLKVKYELHPLESRANQLISADLLPIKIIYDADTVDAIVGMFILPRDVKLQKLSEAAAYTLEELKTQTRAGLEHAINQRKLLDVNISLHSPYLVVPENGVMTDSARVLVADLGHLQITSDMQYNVPSARTASLAKLQEDFYDHFNIKIEDVQLIVAGPGDDWQGAQSASPFHVLTPTSLELQLKKSLLPNDTRLPSVKVSGELPRLTLSLSDKKIKQILTILHKLPIPPPSLANKPVEPKYSREKMAAPTRMDTRQILGTLSDGLLVGREEGDGGREEGGGGLEERQEESDIEEEEDDGEDDSDDFITASEGEDEESSKPKQPSPGKRKPAKSKTEDATGEEGDAKDERKDSSADVASTTKLWLQFTVNEIAVYFSEHQESTGADTPRLNLIVSSVGTTVTLHSWDLCVEASVGSLTAKDHYSKGASETLLVTKSAENMKFLSIKYCKYDRRAPNYPSLSGLTEQSLEGSMSLVKVHIERESVINFAAIIRSIVSIVKKDGISEDTDQSRPKPIQDTDMKPAETDPTPTSTKRLPDEKDFHLDFQLAGLDVTLCDSGGDVVSANIAGLRTEVDLYKDKTVIAARMANIAVLDSEPGSIHSEVIAKVDESQEIIAVKVTVWQGATRAAGYSDLDQADLGVEAQVERLRVTLSFRFINRMKNFATSLLTELKLHPSTIDAAREAAAKTASRAVEALKEHSSSRLRLSVTIKAPEVVVPYFALSQSALVADLGLLEISNEFLFASDGAVKKDVPASSFLSSRGLPAIVDHITIRVSKIKLSRVDDLQKQKQKQKEEQASSDEHLILKPLTFEGHVAHRLSDWCTVIPLVDVVAKLETVEVSFSPTDFEAVMCVISSLDEGKMEPDQIAPASSPSAAEEDRDQDRAEKEDTTTDLESSTSAANIHISAAVELVKLQLHSTEGALADVSLKGLSTDVSVLGTKTQVTVTLSDIQVRDLSFTKFPEIVSVAEKAEAVQAKVVVYTAAMKGDSRQDVNQWDLSVGVRVGCIRVVVVFLFINRLLDYVKQFNVSRKTIESAKKSAQESATAAVSAVQEMHQDGQRVKLDVEIDAPEITIPVSSQSNEALVVDLGELNLSNTFHHYTVEGSSFDAGKLPIYEKISVVLKKLQIYRAILHRDIDCKRHVLDPFTFDLCLKRNLSAAWYKGMPTIDMSANLGTLEMFASGDDIDMACRVLVGNFQEGSGTRTSPETKGEEKAESDDSAEEQEVEMREEDTGSPPEGRSDSKEEPYETVKFSAELQKIALMLYKTGEVLDPHEESSWNRDPDLGLAQVTLLRFHAAASVKSTGTVTASAAMENCVLEDRRSENKGKITRMVEKIPGDAEVKPVIKLTYEMSEWGDKNVLTELDGVQVLVNVQFIKILIDFITSSIKPITAKPRPVPESKSGLIPPEHETQKPVTSSSKSESEAMDAGPADTSKMTIRVVVSRPRIALLEHAEQNSRALVLRTAVEFGMVIAHGQLSMSTEVKELCITSSWYESLHDVDREASRVLAPVQQPILISLSFLKGSSTIGSVSIPSLFITLSPTTVRLILHIATSVAPDKSDEDSTGVTAPTDLFKPQALDPWKWYFSPSWEEGQEEEDEGEGEREGAGEREGEKDEGTSVDLPDNVGTEQITMKMESLRVLVEQELPTGGTLPVVAIAMGKYGRRALTLTIKDWSEELAVSAEMSLEASYFSRYHDCWEPLLEPVINPHKENKYTAWSLTAEVERPMLESGSDSRQPQQEELPPEMAVKISSQNALQLTFTKTSLRILMELVRAYTEVVVSEEVDAAAPETQEAAYTLVNKLGKDYPVTVVAKEGLKIHGAYGNKVVYHGLSLPLHPTEDWPKMQPGELLTEGMQTRTHMLQLQLDNFHPLDVIIGPYEKIYYPLRPRQPHPPRNRDTGSAPPPIKFGLVVEIDRNVTGRTPTVTLRSPVQIVNHMNERVEVYWTEDGDPASQAPPTTGPIATVAKQDTVVLPLREAHLGQFFLRPKIEGLQTCHSPLSWRLPNKALGDIPCYPEGAIPGEQSSGKLPHYIRVNVEPEVYNKMPLSLGDHARPHHVFHLHHPLLVHNLLPAVLQGMEAGSGVEIQPGTSAQLHRTTLSTPHKIQVMVFYDDKTWNGILSTGPRTPEYSTLTLSTKDEQDNSLVLMVHKEEKSTWHLSFYSPYWMVNKTTLTLQYSAKNSSEVYTHPPSKTITLYPHKNVRVRVVSEGHHSEWSQPFSLDALGSEGIFSCKIFESVYQLGTEVHMSSFGLSRVVTISPFFMIYNMTRDDITFLEANSVTETTTVPPMTLVPFWPQANTDSNTMQVAVNDPELSHCSKPFQYTATKCLLVRTNGKEIPAVEVEIQVTASANIITFNPYYNGVVPLQLVNDTDFFIEFRQGPKHDEETPCWLEPGETVMYAWDDPLTAKELIWNLRKRPEKTYRAGTKDDSGDFSLPKARRGSEASTTSTFKRASRASRSSRGSTDSTDSALSSLDPGFPGMADLGMLEEREEEEEREEGMEGGDYEMVDPEEEGEEEDRVEAELDQPDFPGRGFFKLGSAVVKAGRAMGSSLRRKIRRKRKKQGNKGYWISFMDGLQRVVLFTTIEAIQKNILEGNRTERAHLEVTLSLSAVGISLVNDRRRLEVAYIGLPPSDAVWETAKHVRWKPVPRDMKDSLETLYSDREKLKEVVDLTGTNYWVDFTTFPKMTLIEKKNGAIRKLRRSHFEGLCVELAYSKHYTAIQARISNVQIDNHIPFALNPTILYVWPPPPALSSKFAPKPFIEASLIIKHTEQSNVVEIKLLQVLIQEMGLTLDMGFIFAMIRMVEDLSSTRVTEDTLIEEEVERSALPLKESKVADVSAVTSRKHFRLLHLSPLHLHLSFSLERSGWEKEATLDSERNPIFGFAINGFSSLATIIGKTKDAELKLGYFEVENVTSTDKQLRSRIEKHYMHEAVINMYKVVLGLEVLGNPVGFVKGLKQGAVGLFYQPFEGAVLGPEEFFKGLGLGGRQFLGGTIGGVSGLVGRVTGVFGDTLADLTFDKEYKERRKQSSGVGGGTHIGQGLEGAAKGLYEGVTGIVTQPIKGAKTGGVLGFMKGAGKGFIGVFVKPLGGLIDLTSATLTAVQKKTHVGDTDVVQIRAPRFIGPDKIVYPYSLHKAEGYALFLAMDNGRLAESDMYFEHVELVEKPLKVLLVTNNRFAVIKHSDFFGKFDDDWRVNFSEVVDTSYTKNNVISIPVKEPQPGGLTGFFSPRRGNRTTTKTLTVKSAQLAEKAVKFINQAFEEYRATEKLEAQ